MTRKILLDVDTGIDDMVAIIMATKSEKVQVQGLIATSGNQPRSVTLKNTLSVCQLLGQRAPVYRGSSTPLVKEAHFATHIHGTEGLGGVVFPPLSKEAEKGPGVLYLIDMIRKHPHEITVVATGPLTDIALAFTIAPDIIPLIDALVIMGGGIECGNVTAHAEFNFYYDSEAAQIVFSSQAHIVLVPLNVTSLITIDERRLTRYEQFDDEVITMMCSSLRYYQQAYKNQHLHDPIIHDALCVAYLIDPGMFSGTHMDVTVHCEHDEYYGKMSVKENKESFTFVASDIDRNSFFSLFDSLLALS